MNAVKKIQLREEVEWFALEMEKKLRANDRKGHWRGCTLAYLRRRLREERAELLDRLDDLHMNTEPDEWKMKPTCEQAQEIKEEAADVANFAMMIADVVRHAANGKVDGT